jgi:hypothetical protein
MKSVSQGFPTHLNDLPRKAENPTNETKEGRNAKDRMTRYGLAYSNAGAPLGSTELSARSGLKNIRGVPTIAIKNPTKSA